MSAEQRRLTAILAADVAGYTRLMGKHEKTTLDALHGHIRKAVEPKIAEHGGRIVKLMGDGVLAEFPSAVEAVKSAVDIQVMMAERNSGVASERRIEFRMGINIGDVIVDGDDIYGDGVNLTARLEQQAEPGAICISRNVRDQIRDRLPLTVKDLGEIEAKNVHRPVRAFSIPMDDKAKRLATGVKAEHARPGRPSARISTAVGCVAAIAALLLGWFLWQNFRNSDEILLDVRNSTPSIVVLPFQNLSNGPDDEYFADGLTDDLITDLSKVSSLLVIARDSAFAFKNRGEDATSIARELGVRYVVDGSIRRSGNSVRINARLTDSQANGLVWAERFDRDRENIFTVQDEVLNGIVGALSIKLTESEQADVTRLPTENLEAYDYYLRAERLAYRPEVASVGDALRYY